MAASPGASQASTTRRDMPRSISSGTTQHLDTYLADPQALIPGAIMLYKQKNAAVRKAIISFLKEQK